MTPQDFRQLVEGRSPNLRLYIMQDGHESFYYSAGVSPDFNPVTVVGIPTFEQFKQHLRQHRDDGGFIFDYDANTLTPTDEEDDGEGEYPIVPCWALSAPERTKAPRPPLSPPDPT